MKHQYVPLNHTRINQFDRETSICTYELTLFSAANDACLLIHLRVYTKKTTAISMDLQRQESFEELQQLFVDMFQSDIDSGFCNGPAKGHHDH